MSDSSLAALLSEALDLCARARKLDAIVVSPDGRHCGTPVLWVQEQYEADLADWERRAKEALQ